MTLWLLEKTIDTNAHIRKTELWLAYRHLNPKKYNILGNIFININWPILKPMECADRIFKILSKQLLCNILRLETWWDAYLHILNLGKC